MRPVPGHDPTRATWGGADEKDPVSFNVPAAEPMTSQDVIAAELHNYSAGDADASLQLTGSLG